jgi:hypothetical protein
MRDKKDRGDDDVPGDRGDDDVPGDVLKRMGEDDLRLMTPLINNMCMKMDSDSRISLRLQEEENRSYKMQPPSHNKPHFSLLKHQYVLLSPT